MKKNLFAFLLVILFVLAVAGMWKTNAVIGKMIDETGYIKCIPEKTRPELCQKFSFYRAIFLTGAIPMMVMLIFRKKIIKGD